MSSGLALKPGTGSGSSGLRLSSLEAAAAALAWLTVAWSANNTSLLGGGALLDGWVCIAEGSRVASLAFRAAISMACSCT